MYDQTEIHLRQIHRKFLLIYDSDITDFHW